MQPDDPANAPTDVQLFVHQLYKRCPNTYVTPLVVALNLIVFVFLLIKGAGITGGNIEVYADYGANIGALTKEGEWWRLLTANFLHFGIVHLAFNMWALWDAGRLTERLYGHANFLSIYLYTGLFASLGSLLWNNDAAVSAGASGAVFGVLGALLGYLMKQKNIVPVELFKQLRHSVLLFIGFALFYGFSVPGIDNAAHIGGLLSGLLLGIFLSSPVTQARHSKNKTMIVNLFSILALLNAIHFAPPAEFDYQAQQVMQKNIRHFVEEERRLLDNWRGIISQFKGGQTVNLQDMLLRLNRQHSDWLSLQQLMRPHGKIRSNTETTIKQLAGYASLRAQNAVNLMTYVETGKEEYLLEIKQNNQLIEAAINELSNKQP